MRWSSRGERQGATAEFRGVGGGARSWGGGLNKLQEQVQEKRRSDAAGERPVWCRVIGPCSSEQTVPSSEQTADLPGQTADLPEQTADLPGQTADLPGRTADLPGQTPDPAGRTVDPSCEVQPLRRGSPASASPPVARLCGEQGDGHLGRVAKLSGASSLLTGQLLPDTSGSAVDPFVPRPCFDGRVFLRRAHDRQSRACHAHGRATVGIHRPHWCRSGCTRARVVSYRHLGGASQRKTTTAR